MTDYKKCMTGECDHVCLDACVRYLGGELATTQKQRDDMMSEADDLQCAIASAAGWDMKGETFDEWILRGKAAIAIVDKLPKVSRAMTLGGGAVKCEDCAGSGRAGSILHACKPCHGHGNAVEMVPVGPGDEVWVEMDSARSAIIIRSLHWHIDGYHSIDSCDSHYDLEDCYADEFTAKLLGGK